jgi:transposase
MQATPFQQWHRSVMSSRPPRVKKGAESLKAHLGGLLTYFKHRISNPLTEGFNSKIQALKANARGFRKLPPFENYRSRSRFFCGRLDLAPHLPSAATHSIP